MKDTGFKGRGNFWHGGVTWTPTPETQKLIKGMHDRISKVDFEVDIAFPLATGCPWCLRKRDKPLEQLFCSEECEQKFRATNRNSIIKNLFHEWEEYKNENNR